jgi:hypothetical protein
MNEYPPYTQDTSWRAMATYDPQSMSYLRIPSYLVMDEPGRAGYPIVSPTFNDRRFKFEWSEKTLRDLEARILRKADSVAGLAAQMGVAENVLARTIADWNEACDGGRDSVHGRPTTSMVRIATPPFYFAEVWPVCSNTQGGPVHDAEQRVIDAFGQPIGRLFAAANSAAYSAIYLGRQPCRMLRRRLDRRRVAARLAAGDGNRGSRGASR